MKPLVVRPIHGQHAYAIDRSELGPTYELTFAKHGRGFRVRMESETGDVVHVPWARVQRDMHVFGWVSHNAEAVGRGPAAGTRTHEPIVGLDSGGEK